MRDIAGVDQWRALAIEEVRTAHVEVRSSDEAARRARARLHDRAAKARGMGLTLAEIGEAMGVSRQRVHEMLR